MTVAKAISKYKLVELLGVQEVRWNRGGIEPEGEYVHYSMERGMRIMN
jgi:hypothetical protein